MGIIGPSKSDQTAIEGIYYAGIRESDLRLDFDLLFRVFIEPVHVNLAVKVADVAHNCIVFHLRKMFSCEPCRNRKQISDMVLIRGMRPLPACPPTRLRAAL